jgi:HAD superfamily hydrolase (TIGR01509 family)
MIKTIIFDLSEVLIAGLVGIEEPISKLLNLSERTITKAFYNDRLFALCRGEISEDEYLGHILNEYGDPHFLDRLKQIIRNNFQHCVPGMVPILERLKNRYELVLLSDHAREWIAYIQSVHPFLEAFDQSFFSFDLGTTKDDSVTFRTVLDAIDCEPSQCLFIDDNPMNIETAASLGISCVRFVSTANLTQRLEALGLWH